MKFAVQFFIFLFLQIFLFEKLSLYDLAYPKILMAYLLFLPMEWNLSLQFGVAFMFGFLLSLFVEPVGAHAFAAVLALGARQFWLSAISPQINMRGGSGIKDHINLETQPLNWQFTYLVPLIFLFEFTFHILADFQFTSRTFLKILSSGLYSSLFSFLITIFFFKKTEKK